jgi:uncharacterized protein
MLSFDIRSLESKAEQVNGSLSPDDDVWEEGDARPAKPIGVSGRLSSANEGRFYFSGRLTGEVAMPCRRCLEDVAVEVDDEVHFIFAEKGADEADDPDVYTYDPNARELDLRPAVRESWLLIAPAYAQCREDCKGLCPSCGQNLNEGACDCAPAKTDSRWDALLSLKSDSR